MDSEYRKHKSQCPIIGVGGKQVLSPFGFSTYYWFFIGRLNTLSFGRICNPTACVRMDGISLPDLSFGRICNPTAWSIGICNPESPLMPALQMPIFASGGLQIRQNRKGQAPQMHIPPDPLIRTKRLCHN